MAPALRGNSRADRPGSGRCRAASGLAGEGVELWPESDRRHTAASHRGTSLIRFTTRMGRSASRPERLPFNGRNGLRIMQILSADNPPGAYGFSPRPTPLLVAAYQTWARHRPVPRRRPGPRRGRAGPPAVDFPPARRRPCKN